MQPTSPAEPSTASTTAPGGLFSRIMGSCEDITPEEKTAILTLMAARKSERDIADIIGRSKTAVHNVVVKSRVASREGTDQEGCLLVTPSSLRGMFLRASTGTLHNMYSCPVSVRRVQQLLTNSQNLVYKKMHTGPRLSLAHVAASKKWALEHATWRSRWKRVVFSDEKKFNLDGPDGFAYHWHDIRKEERYFSKRQQGGGSVMVWAVMSYYGLSSMVVLNGTLKFEDYCDVLSRGFPISGRRILSRRLDIPARIPSPIDTVEELTKVIDDCWWKIAESTIRNLYKGICKSFLAVMENG